MENNEGEGSNMTSIVYVLGQGSRWNNFEIRYSLRSIERHLPGTKDVWIIGWLPDFLKGINHIPAEDIHRIPDSSIMAKILLACKEPNISENFLFCNDDHYLLDDFEADAFPSYYCSSLDQYILNRSHGMKITDDPYAQRAKNTLDYLKERNLPIKYFDVHFPILYNKTEFIRIFSALPPDMLDLPNQGYILKSLYANSLQIEGEEVNRDCKLQGAPPPKFKCFSTFPRVSGEVYQFLNWRFPEKSKWEV